MSHWECLSCHSTYSDTLPDGGGYHHACAPVYDPLGFRSERENKRDENLVHPPDRRSPPAIRSEGAGRRPAAGPTRLPERPAPPPPPTPPGP